jgi:hypothetical protein
MWLESFSALGASGATFRPIEDQNTRQRPLWFAQAGVSMLTHKRYHSGKRRAELLRGSMRKKKQYETQAILAGWKEGSLVEESEWGMRRLGARLQKPRMRGRLPSRSLRDDLCSEGSGGFHDYAGCGPQKHVAIDCVVHRYAIAAMNPGIRAILRR